MKICALPSCGKPVIRTSAHANNVKYHTPKCRAKDEWARHRDTEIAKQRAKSGAYAKGKKQCLMCQGWYIKVLAHVYQLHHMSAREYKEYYDLPLQKGIIPDWHREILRDHALENNMDTQLQKAGVLTRYKKNDKKAKDVTGWKGRHGCKKAEETDYY